MNIPAIDSASRHFLRPMALALGLFSFQTMAQSGPETQRIYSHITHELLLGNPVRNRTPSSLVTGSCWVFTLGEERVIATAAHNLGWGPNYNPAKIEQYVIGRNCRLLSLTAKPVLGLLAHGVKEVGLLGDDVDLLLLRPAQQEALNGSRTISLAKEPPKQGDKVTIHGYPGQPIEKELTATVRVAVSGRNFIVLESDSREGGGVRPGFSGGVVLNGAKEAVALVVTTGTNHCNALLVSGGLFGAVKWKALTEVQTRKF